VLAEQRSTHDAQRELHHVAPEIEHVAWCEPTHQCVRFLGDERRVALNALVAEARLDAAPLTAPLLPVAGEQPVAQQLQIRGALVEATCLSDQHLVDQVGMARGVNVHLRGLGIVKVAVSREALADGAQHVAA
jgi:hypothetical protein